MNKKLTILIGLAILLFGSMIFFKIGNIDATAFSNLSSEGKWFLPLVGVAALIDSINPCAFGILLLTIAFLLSLQKTRISILKIGGAYIFGLFTIYVLIGLGILQALHFFNMPQFMSKIGAALLIAFGGINIINEFFPSFPIKFRIPQAAHGRMASLMNKASLPAMFFLGVLVGLFEFPCTGGAYLMILGLLHDQGTYFAGVGYLLFYNLIFVSPLIVILLIASDETLVAKMQAWKKSEAKHLKIWGGVAMIILGLLIFVL